jgi:uncharacterized protein YjiS (DUF1127 family)
MEQAMSKQHSVVGKVVDAFGDWLRRRRDIRELRELDSGEFEKIARDLNVPPADLDTLVHQGPHAADELSDLLTLLGVDSDLLSRTKPLVLRDMASVCASCQQKRRCNRDLAAGTSAHHYAEYCSNALEIEELKARAG